MLYSCWASDEATPICKSKPTSKKDGSIDIDVRVNPDLDKSVNAGFRGKWVNAENVGKSEAEIVALWNQAHPDNPIEA